ncbi:MAG: hypothetical protein ACOX75_02500 [Lachnospiraceae bacterium]|jgi:hypothetical protein
MSFWNFLKRIVNPNAKWSKGNDIYGLREKQTVSARDDEGSLDFLDPNMGVTRSAFYHSYWSGWAETRIDRLGKPYKIDRIYVAPWIKQNLRACDYVLVRVLYGIMLLLSIALFVFAMTRRIGSNYCKYVAAPGMITGILIIPVAWIFVVYAKAKKLMTIWEHQVSSVWLYRISFVFSMGLLATMLTTIIYVILNPADNLNAHLLNIGLELVAGGLSFAVFFFEKRMKYVNIPNENQAPFGSKVIR